MLNLASRTNILFAKFFILGNFVEILYYKNLPGSNEPRWNENLPLRRHAAGGEFCKAEFFLNGKQYRIVDWILDLYGKGGCTDECSVA